METQIMEQKIVTKQDIINEVISQVNNFFSTDCTEKTRRENVVIPRMYACCIMSELVPSLTLTEIGKRFNVSHCTVIHYKKKIEDVLKLYPRERMNYIRIKSLVEKSDVYKNSDFVKSITQQTLLMELYDKILSKDIHELRELLAK